MSDPVFSILAKLANVQSAGDGQWSARCPVHDDSRNSLCIGTGEDGRALITCQAGCDRMEIMRAVGGMMSDLFPKRSANGHARTNGKPRGNIKAIYSYRDENNILLYQSCRMEPKDFRQRRPHPEKPGEFIWDMKGVRKVPYRLPQLLAADPSEPVFIVEGEKDADNLASGGLIVTTNVSGAGKWLREYVKHFRGRHVVILPDNDDPGRSHAADVAAKLYGTAASIRILNLPGLPPKGDVSDWATVKGNTPRRLEQLAAAAPLWTPPNEPLKPAAANEADDDPHRLARLFIAGYQHPEGLTIRYWQDQFWRWDGQAFRKLPDHEIRALLTAHVKAEFDRICTEKLAAPRPPNSEPPTSQKISNGLIANVIQALAGMTLLSDRLDQPCWLGGPHAARNPHDFISMSNGILDIEALLFDDADTGDILLSHSPQWFSSICLPFEFDPSADCPQWLRFVHHNLESDQDRIDMLQEFFGYCLTPDTSYQKFMLMEGEGSNGKSVICAALAALLGAENVCHVPLELFGQRFALTQTIGKLANIFSEVGELDKIAEGFLKSFTSGDRMTFDRKHQEPIEALPTARLVLATNNRPRFSDRSGGLWRRMLLLPLRVQITEDQKIHGMDKPNFWKPELPGVFLWAVAGLRELRRYRRFTDPEVCRKAIEEYKSENNTARKFVEEHCEADANGSIVTQELYAEYRKWCERNGKKAFSSVEFGKEIVRKFPSARAGKIVRDYLENGRTIKKRFNGYSGVTIKSENDPDIPDIDSITF